MTKAVAPGERLNVQEILGLGSNPRRGWPRRVVKWAAAAAGGILLLLSISSWLGGGTDNVRYVARPVTRGKLTVVVTATGSLQPTNQVDISSELSGAIREVLVDYNSVVEAGQLLARLDIDKLAATVNGSRAKLMEAKAKVAEADATVVEKKSDVERKKKLTVIHATSVQDLDQSQGAYDRALAAAAVARAGVDVAEAQLNLDEANLAKAAIRSPISGVVLKRNVDPGQIVASTLQTPVLFSIAEDLQRMELRLDIDEADVGQIRTGQNATFTVDAYPERKFPASIRLVRFASETVQGVVTYKGVLTVSNSELLLRPGMTATAQITVAEIPDALLIPNAALRYTPSSGEETTGRGLLQRLLPGPPPLRSAGPVESIGRNRTVWVLRDGQPMRAQVVVGASDGKNTEIGSGDLQVGDVVIIDRTISKS